jgi:hypothetical protein
MDVPYAPPEQQPPERRTYRVLLVVLLAFLMLLALFLVFLLVRLPVPRLISYDWSGYAVASDLENPQPQVTSINGSWTVPTVKVSTEDSFSAVWIGVGGQFDDTLIQTGTEQDWVRGQGTYSAWYELLPNDAVTIDSLSISPGDSIAASISLLDQATNAWSIEIHDATSGQWFQKSLTYLSSMLSAGWIVERPTLNDRVRTLADFGQVTFTDCTVTVGGKVGTIGSFPCVQLIMYNRQNAQLVGVSTLTASSSSFTVNFSD